MDFNQCSSRGKFSDDKEAVSILKDSIKHIGDRYQIGLPWMKDISLPNNYFMAKIQWHALQRRLERDSNLRDRYEEPIKKNWIKTTSQLRTPVADTLSGTIPIKQRSTNRNQTKSAESQTLLPNIKESHSRIHC